ncbi:hypothetical protein M8J75_015949 [Diaphorina citri]|nr:hypothetical protein M8J75_015949 [Diaphorina citri]
MSLLVQQTKWGFIFILLCVSPTGGSVRGESYAELNLSDSTSSSYQNDSQKMDIVKAILLNTTLVTTEIEHILVEISNITASPGKIENVTEDLTTNANYKQEEILEKDMLTNTSPATSEITPVEVSTNRNSTIENVPENKTEINKQIVDKKVEATTNSITIETDRESTSEANMEIVNVHETTEAIDKDALDKMDKPNEMIIIRTTIDSGDKILDKMENSIVNLTKVTKSEDKDLEVTENKMESHTMVNDAKVLETTEKARDAEPAEISTEKEMPQVTGKVKETSTKVDNAIQDADKMREVSENLTTEKTIAKNTSIETKNTKEMENIKKATTMTDGMITVNKQKPTTNEIMDKSTSVHELQTNATNNPNPDDEDVRINDRENQTVGKIIEVTGVNGITESTVGLEINQDRKTSTLKHFDDYITSTKTFATKDMDNHETNAVIGISALKNPHGDVSDIKTNTNRHLDNIVDNIKTSTSEYANNNSSAPKVNTNKDTKIFNYDTKPSSIQPSQGLKHYSKQVNPTVDHLKNTWSFDNILKASTDNHSQINAPLTTAQVGDKERLRLVQTKLLMKKQNFAKSPVKYRPSLYKKHSGITAKEIRNENKASENQTMHDEIKETSTNSKMQDNKETKNILGYISTGNRSIQTVRKLNPYRYGTNLFQNLFIITSTTTANSSGSERNIYYAKNSLGKVIHVPKFIFNKKKPLLNTATLTSHDTQDRTRDRGYKTKTQTYSVENLTNSIQRKPMGPPTITHAFIMNFSYEKPRLGHLRANVQDVLVKSRKDSVQNTQPYKGIHVNNKFNMKSYEANHFISLLKAKRKTTEEATTTKFFYPKILYQSIWNASLIPTPNIIVTQTPTSLHYSTTEQTTKVGNGHTHDETSTDGNISTRGILREAKKTSEVKTENPVIPTNNPVTSEVHNSYAAVIQTSEAITKKLIKQITENSTETFVNNIKMANETHATSTEKIVSTPEETEEIEEIEEIEEFEIFERNRTADLSTDNLITDDSTTAIGTTNAFHGINKTIDTSTDPVCTNHEINPISDIRLDKIITTPVNVCESDTVEKRHQPTLLNALKPQYYDNILHRNLLNETQSKENNPKPTENVLKEGTSTTKILKSTTTVASATKNHIDKEKTVLSTVKNFRDGKFFDLLNVDYINSEKSTRNNIPNLYLSQNHNNPTNTKQDLESKFLDLLNMDYLNNERTTRQNLLKVYLGQSESNDVLSELLAMNKPLGESRLQDVANDSDMEPDNERFAGFQAFLREQDKLEVPIEQTNATPVATDIDAIQIHMPSKNMNNGLPKNMESATGDLKTSDVDKINEQTHHQMQDEYTKDLAYSPVNKLKFLFVRTTTRYADSRWKTRMDKYLKIPSELPKEPASKKSDATNIKFDSKVSQMKNIVQSILEKYVDKSKISQHGTLRKSKLQFNNSIARTHAYQMEVADNDQFLQLQPNPDYDYDRVLDDTPINPLRTALYKPRAKKLEMETTESNGQDESQGETGQVEVTTEDPNNHSAASSIYKVIQKVNLLDNVYSVLKQVLKTPQHVLTLTEQLARMF